MGATIDIGGGLTIECSKAFVRVVTEAIRRHAADEPELAAIAADEALFDAIGWWDLRPLSPRALRRLVDVLAAIAVELPTPIAHWPEDARSRFDVAFSRLRLAFDARSGRLSPA